MIDYICNVRDGLYHLGVCYNIYQFIQHCLLFLSLLLLFSSQSEKPSLATADSELPIQVNGAYLITPLCTFGTHDTWYCKEDKVDR